MKDLDLANFALKGFLLSAFCFGFVDLWYLNLFYVENPNLRAIWSQITYIGDSEWMLIGALGFGSASYAIVKYRQKKKIGNWWLWKQRYEMAIFVFTSVALTGIFSSLAKNSIGRARPYLVQDVGPHAFQPFAFDSKWAAWPSGHTTTAFAMATALAILMPKYRVFFFAVATIAGISRTTLGAHYLSDVIMGATVGVVGTVLIARWLTPKLKFAFYPRNPRNTQATNPAESDIPSVEE